MFPSHNPAQQVFNGHCRSNNISESNLSAAAVDMREHVYCYANFNEGMIESNCQRHYVDSPSLLGRHEGYVEIQTSQNKKKKCGGCQQNLF